MDATQDTRQHHRSDWCNHAYSAQDTREGQQACRFVGREGVFRRRSDDAASRENGPQSSRVPPKDVALFLDTAEPFENEDEDEDDDDLDDEDDDDVVDTDPELIIEGEQDALLRGAR
jgi:hypothetical protein